jgi:oligopeptidase B
VKAHSWSSVAWAVLVASSVVARAEVGPPVAKRIEHRETWHGETLVDEYHWLREKSNPEVLRHLEAENAYTTERTKDLQPLEETIYQEMLARIKQSDLSVPTRRSGFYYYQRTDEGRQYGVQCRRRGSMEADEEVLLDPNELAQGHDYFSLGSVAISDDQNLVAYTTDTTGYRQYVLHVKDLRTGETQSDLRQRVTSVVWAADNATLFVATEDEVTKRSNQLWRHVLASADWQLLHEEKDELYRVSAQRTRDKRFVVVQINCENTSEVRYLPADRPTDQLRTFAARRTGHRYRIDHRDGQFYIWTNRDGKNFQVMQVPEDDPSEANWQAFLPHRDDVLVAGFEAFRDFAVVTEKSNALNSLRVYDFRAQRWHDLSFPEPVYAAFSSFNPEFDEPTFRYNYQSLVTPPSVFDFDVDKLETKLVKQQEVLGGYDPSQYVSERLWVTARDGVKVPLSVVYKKGFHRDGSGPLLMVGYGSYGNAMSASFSSERFSLLNRGMAVVIAHVRGGNEMGESWREDGKLMKKKNTFYDFVDCAQYLVDEKWTSPDRFAIEGASAGGLLMGAVVNLRPDLFRAVHAGVPFVDVINTMMDASLPLTVGEYLEWGNPHDKLAYEYMKSYSPYDNLKHGAYPAMLVTTSLNDSQVMYWEPAKYVARMRALKTDDNTLLLKVNMAGGHSGSSGRYSRLREEAFQYAWLMSQLGIAE